MQWSRQQEQALRSVDYWLQSRDQQVFYLAGFAGTGKTTLATYFAQNVEGLVLFAAYTGKAASVLRSKGCPDANTIHHYLYSVADADRTKLNELMERLQGLQEELQQSRLEDGEPSARVLDWIVEVEEKIAEERARLRGPRFRLNPDSPIRDASLVVLDEASMINEHIGRDLESFGVPILIIGDPAQLPPVQGSGYFTKRDPDILLTEIHRQAADNPIIQYATAIRQGERLPFGDHGLARKIKRDDVDVSMLAESDQVLCGTNKMRRKINRKVRKHLGRASLYPLEGDKLVILRNEKEYGVLNGVTCRALTEAHADPFGYDDDLYIRLEYDGQVIPLVPMDRGPFDIYNDPNLPEDWLHNRHLVQMDYGYALTVHKAQGSQWPSVFIIDDGFAARQPRQHQRWLYTAVTRAEREMTLAV